MDKDRGFRVVFSVVFGPIGGFVFGVTAWMVLGLMFPSWESSFRAAGALAVYTTTILSGVFLEDLAPRFYSFPKRWFLTLACIPVLAFSTLLAYIALQSGIWVLVTASVLGVILAFDLLKATRTSFDRALLGTVVLLGDGQLWLITRSFHDLLFFLIMTWIVWHYITISLQSS